MSWLDFDVLADHVRSSETKRLLNAVVRDDRDLLDEVPPTSAMALPSRRGRRPRKTGGAS
jgi:hypothetical protein